MRMWVEPLPQGEGARLVMAAEDLEDVNTLGGLREEAIACGVAPERAGVILGQMRYRLDGAYPVVAFRLHT